MLLNVLDFAVKSFPGTTVKIKHCLHKKVNSCKRATLEFTICDQGSWIGEDEVERMFDLHCQSSNLPNHSGKSRLLTCKRICQSLGGDI